MGFSKGKKGAIEVSVNVIIILIFAIAILGIGLAFINNMVKKATDSFTDVSDSIKNERIENLKNSNDKISLSLVDFKVSIKDTNKEVYIAVKNVYDTTILFTLPTINCTAIEPASPAPIVVAGNNITVAAGQTEVRKLIVKASPSTAKSNYNCAVKVFNATNLYAETNMMVEVTD